MTNVELLVEKVEEYIEKTYGKKPDVEYGYVDYPDDFLLGDVIHIRISSPFLDFTNVYEYECDIEEYDLEHYFITTLMNVLKGVSDEITDVEVRKFLTDVYNEKVNG